MIEGHNIIGASVSKRGTQTLQAVNPKTGEPFKEDFHIATQQEADTALQKAEQAFQTYKNVTSRQKAAFLRAIGDEIMALGDDLIQRASAESALPAGRLQGERGRTVNQLRLFADLLDEGSWVDARIDTATESGPDVRSMLFALGPVVVFGASNFPLAFSTAGGDTAAALAAGCPVVVKAHESHLGTNELIAGAIQQTAQKTDMPDGVFSALVGGKEVGGALVQHPAVKAVGFTGSFAGGKAIYDLAQQREEPIPVYAEMGSINPVFLLNQKLETDPENLARQYAGSVTLGVGQFCTNPGLLIGLKSPALDTFKQTLAKELKTTGPGTMLNAGIAAHYQTNRETLLDQSGVETLLSASGQTAPALGSVTGGDFLTNDQLQQEVFGPFTLIVECTDKNQLRQVAKKLNGQLTLTFMATNEELPRYTDLLNICREKAGRILFNGVPTGVRVCHAMQHGGPFPATTDAKFTSVGTAAIRRFVRPVAYQDWPEILLPDELKSDNPLDIYRLHNGSFEK